MFRSVRRAIFCGLFAAEVGIYMWAYVYGSQGMQDIWQLQTENSKIEQQIAGISQEIGKLDAELTAWGEQPFYKEKVAREQLQMARENEMIYYVS